MFDVETLQATCDVSIKLYSFRCVVTFTSPPSSTVRQALEFFNEIGISALSERDRIYNIHPNNYDIVQIAERIAVGLEQQGLKVKRLASRVSIAENNPEVEVQSFILA